VRELRVAGTAPVESDLMRLSASQVQTFLDCARKWSWRYVEGIEEPPSPAAERGRAVHAVLEGYLSGGAIDFTTELGYIAAAGLEHLPKPSTPGLRIEEEFHFEGPSGHTYLGYKDLEQPELGIIYDHKTISDLRWAKTEQELENDIQATLYATDYFRQHPEHSDVELRWVYYQTKNTRKSTVVRVRVNQTDTWQRFLEIERTAAAMEVASTLRALDLPPNIRHCDAYGGCPHQGRCNLSPLDKMRSHVEQNKLVQLLKIKNNGAAAPAPPAAPPATALTPAAPAAPAMPAAFALGGAFHGTQAAATYVPPAAPAAPPQNKLLARLQAGGAPAAASVAPAGVPVAPVPAAINPPEFQQPPVAAPTAPSAVVVETSRELATSLSIPSATVAQAAAEKRGRGRPTKVTVPETGIVAKIKILYVNCGPVGVAVMDATHFIARAKQTIAAGGLADYRFAEYGQGPGLLAVAVAAEIDALDGVLSALRLDTTTPEGSIVLVELQARAELVVR